MQCHECILIKNTVFSLLDWTCNTQQRLELQKCEGYTSFSFLRSESWLRIKPLCLSKAGAFSSVLGMPEWLQCSVVFMNAFRWCLFFMQHICVPSSPSPKKTTTQLLSLQIPNRCYAVATVATIFFFQFEGCFWGVASCTICTGTYFKRTGGCVRQ